MHSRLSTILKTSKKLYEVMAFDTWKYVYFESAFNTLYIEIKQMFKKKRYKKCPLFFLLLSCDPYMSWSARFISLKLWVVFSIFDSIPFLSKPTSSPAHLFAKRKAKKRPCNTSNRWSKFAQIESIFLRINYGIRGRRYWEHQQFQARNLYV